MYFLSKQRLYIRRNSDCASQYDAHNFSPYCPKRFTEPKKKYWYHMENTTNFQNPLHPEILPPLAVCHRYQKQIILRSTTSRLINIHTSLTTTRKITVLVKKRSQSSFKTLNVIRIEQIRVNCKKRYATLIGHLLIMNLLTRSLPVPYK